MRESLSKVHEIEKDFCVLLLSLPTRGGWIEIRLTYSSACSRPSPSPHGEGGLKCAFCPSLCAGWTSLPTRGGWIEIRKNEMALPEISCPSPHGEGGLKYQALIRLYWHYLSPSPHGEGGLKLLPMQRLCKIPPSLPTRGGWIEMKMYSTISEVAGVPPHTGRVD